MTDMAGSGEQNYIGKYSKTLRGLQPRNVRNP